MSILGKLFSAIRGGNHSTDNHIDLDDDDDDASQRLMADHLSYAIEMGDTKQAGELRDMLDAMKKR